MIGIIIECSYFNSFDFYYEFLNEFTSKIVCSKHALFEIIAENITITCKTISFLSHCIVVLYIVIFVDFDCITEISLAVDNNCVVFGF